MSIDAIRPFATIILIAAVVLLCGAFWADCLVGPYTPLAAGFQAEMEPWASEADLPATDRQWSPLLWDGVAQFYPWRLLAARAMRDGELALWNPHQMCGYPIVGNGQSALFYPPNWILAAVDVRWGMGLLAALHYALAAVLTILLCRTLGLGHLPAAFAGIAYAFGGFMVTWTQLPTLMNSAAWLPGALLGVALIFRRSRWGVPVLGVSLAMTLLAGHLQIAAYVWIVAAVYALARVVWAAAHRRPMRFAALAAAVGIGLLIGAAQVVPTLELARNSPRGHAAPSEVGWEFHQRIAMQPEQWILFLDPDAFGNPAHGDHELTAWGIPYSEHCGFVGIVTLLLALVGVFFDRTRHFAFFAVLAVASVHIAMAGTLAEFMYMYVPGLGQAGGFSRFLSVFTFAAAMCAAFGLQAICVRARQRDCECEQEGCCPWNLTPAAALCVVALLVLGWELLPWAHGFPPRTEREHVYPVTPAIERLMEAEGRVLEVTPRAEWTMGRVPRAVLPPNAATVYGYESIAGYDSLMLTSYRAFLMQAEDGEPAPAANGNMLLPQRAVGDYQARMALTTVIARRPPEAPDDEDTRIKAVGSHGGVGVWRLEPAPPRAWAGSPESPEPVTLRRPGRSRIAVNVPHPAQRLMVSETFYPGWSAYSEGARREVRAVEDSAFIHVDLDEQDREVRLVFEPATVHLGVFLALVGTALLAGSIVVGGRIGRGN